MVAVTVVAKRGVIVMRFFDRARELADLKEIRERSESVAQFTVVTGRRRVGKTSLSNFRQGRRKDGQIRVERQLSRFLVQVHVSLQLHTGVEGIRAVDVRHVTSSRQ